MGELLPNSSKPTKSSFLGEWESNEMGMENSKSSWEMGNPERLQQRLQWFLDLKNLEEL